MASENQVIRIPVDANDFLATLDVVMRRRNLVPQSVRLEIDRTLEDMQAGVIDHCVRAGWQQEIEPRHSVVYIVAGPALLDLAIPTDNLF